LRSKVEHDLGRGVGHDLPQRIGLADIDHGQLRAVLHRPFKV
jgi:hypothetical protein